ncbi:hypothetical protein SBOR_1592 [Sclerotinia borealis F-4128]|uniref:LIM zinc-binding domain-containing protein n=1 Tax=Sclerotinia borealis (strain F-4128) TaxID=1432307 RepID=W9CQD7_SCLBF|nr:hypothetical protein SBOR_1592 [Sclerotinia borealis F-4128]
MTGRQATPRPPTSAFIELRPRTRHTISLPPLSLASTVSDTSKAIVTPHASLPRPHTSILQPQIPARPTATITAIRTIQKSSDPSFICTICWSPQHPPAAPRVLGRSSRIVCHQCWRAVLDLSICWVCGECIVRGDEVVSLGWCFWHRACFGCLLCGVSLGEGVLKDFEREGDGDGEGDEGDEGSDGGNARKGTELDKIPLCEWCETETKIKGFGEKKVLERGLENVTKSDGGLTRCRLEKLDEDRGLGVVLNGKEKKDIVVGLDGEEMVPSPPSSSSDLSPLSMQKRPSRLSTMNERKISKLIRDSSTPQEEIALLSDAAKMGVSEDGNPDDSTHSHSDTEPADLGPAAEASTSSTSPSASSPSNIYVSIYDPAGRAFIPSKTKPLPKWMSLLPTNVHRDREESRGDFRQRKAGPVVSRAALPDAYADGASSSHSDDCAGVHGPSTPCVTEGGGTGISPGDLSEEVTPKVKPLSRKRASSVSDNIDTPSSTRKPSTSQSTISSLAIPSPKSHHKITSTRPRSVSIEESLPRPHPHPASAYRRGNRSSTIESSSFKSGNISINIQAVPLHEHAPRDVSERPLTPYPKDEDEDPFQGIVGSRNLNVRGAAEGANTNISLLTSPLSTFITPRKGSCCGLSTSLEVANVDALRRRDRDGGESSFDSTFESFPRPEIAKPNASYGIGIGIGMGITSPKLGFLGQGSEYLERCVAGVMLPGGGAEREREREKEREKEGIVEKIRRQRVGTVSLGQVAQTVKEEKLERERKRAETQSQSEWNWVDSGEGKILIKGEEAKAKVEMTSRKSSRRSRGVVSEEERDKLERSGSRDGGRRSLRRSRVGEEMRGMGKEKEKVEREREKLEREKQVKRNIKGKGKEKLKEKEKLQEDEMEVEIEVNSEVGEKSERELKKESRGSFGDE